MPVGMYNMAVYCIVIAIHRAVIVIPTQTWDHNSGRARLFPLQLNIIQGTAGEKEYAQMTPAKLIVLRCNQSIHTFVLFLSIHPFAQGPM